MRCLALVLTGHKHACLIHQMYFTFTGWGKDVFRTRPTGHPVARRVKCILTFYQRKQIRAATHELEPQLKWGRKIWGRMWDEGEMLAGETVISGVGVRDQSPCQSILFLY